MEAVKTLQAIEIIKSNPEIIRLMAEFKRRDFVSTYIVSNQIETEEELTSCWLSDLKKTICNSHVG